MDKRPAARQVPPMRGNTEDPPTSAGHPFFERLKRLPVHPEFDAFVEGLCAAFYADPLAWPRLRPGEYCRLLFIRYFESPSSERRIAWRVADSLSPRSFLDLDLTRVRPDQSTLSRTGRRDLGAHAVVSTCMPERLGEAGLVRAETVGVDATTLEGHAPMRSIERRNIDDSYDGFGPWFAAASGFTRPTPAELGRFDPTRQDTNTSNKRVAVSAGSGREDATPSDAPRPQGEAPDRPADGGHRLRDSAARVGCRYGDPAEDRHTDGRAGRGSAGGRSRRRIGGHPQRAYQSDGTPVALGQLALRGYESVRGARPCQHTTTARRHEGSGLSRRRCIPTAVTLMERRAVVYTGGLATSCSPHFRSSTKQGVCLACGCAALSMSASGSSPTRPVAPSGRYSAASAPSARPPSLQGPGSCCRLRTGPRPNRLLQPSVGPMGFQTGTDTAPKPNRSSPIHLSRRAQRPAFRHGLLTDRP